ncbi:MAG: hypothetical protein AB7Y46_03295 [Armatimonadota bacterium]
MFTYDMADARLSSYVDELTWQGWQGAYDDWENPLPETPGNAPKSIYTYRLWAVRSMVVQAICGVGVVGLLLYTWLWRAGCTRMDGPPAERADEAGAGAGAPFIAPRPATFGDALVRSLSQWVVWPDDEYIDRHLARQDRSADILPLYPATNVEDPKRLRAGAQSPARALAEAARWVRMALRPEWVPDALEGRLVRLQLDPASRSVILCRYKVDGNRFQIAQSRPALCIVTRAVRARSGAASPEETGPDAFRAFLAHGAEMAILPATGPQVADRLHVFFPDQRVSWPEEAHASWWGWRLWCTDG